MIQVSNFLPTWSWEPFDVRIKKLKPTPTDTRRGGMKRSSNPSLKKGIKLVGGRF